MTDEMVLYFRRMAREWFAKRRIDAIVARALARGRALRLSCDDDSDAWARDRLASGRGTIVRRPITKKRKKDDSGRS